MPKFTPLRERVSVAVATKNAEEIRNIKQEIVDAFRASGGDLAHAAKVRLGVNPMTLRRIAKQLRIERRLRIDPEKGKGLGRWSDLGRRLADARERNDAAEIRGIREKIADTFRRNGADIDATASEFDVSPRKLREFTQVLGLSEEFGLDTTSRAPSLILSRARVAVDQADKKAVAQLRKEVVTAIRAAGGNLRQASKALDLSPWGLRQLLQLLDIAEEIDEKFPGQGKPRQLTVRVNGAEVTDTIAGWARNRGLNRTTILERLRRGYTPEQAVSVEDMREAGSGKSRPRRAPRVCRFGSDHPTPGWGDICRHCRKIRREEAKLALTLDEQ